MSDLPGIPKSGTHPSATPIDGPAELAMLHYFVGIMCRIAMKSSPELFEGELRALRIFVQGAPQRNWTPGQLAAARGLLLTIEEAMAVKYVRPVRPGQTNGSDE